MSRIVLIVAVLFVSACSNASESSSGGESPSSPTQEATPDAAPTADLETPLATPTSPAADAAAPPSATDAGAAPASTDAAPTAEDAGTTGDAANSDAAEMHEADGIRITEISIGTGIENHAITEARSTFSRANDSRIYCLVRLENTESRATELRISFDMDGRDAVMPARPLRVPASPRYVTFAYAGLRRPTGAYHCIVRSADGNLLARRAFQVTE